MIIHKLTPTCYVIKTLIFGIEFYAINALFRCTSFGFNYRVISQCFPFGLHTVVCPCLPPHCYSCIGTLLLVAYHEYKPGYCLDVLLNGGLLVFL